VFSKVNVFILQKQIFLEMKRRNYPLEFVERTGNGGKVGWPDWGDSSDWIRERVRDRQREKGRGRERERER